MIAYDFRNLTRTQQSILAAGGWRPGEYVGGSAYHGRPTKPCIEGLIRRGFLIPCEPPHEDAYAVPSEIATAFRDRRRRMAERTATQRAKFQARTIILVGESQRDALIALASNLPLDKDQPLEAVVRERVKPRSLDQNALMWAGPLADIEEQAWVRGRQFCAEVWHHHFKTLYLPEDDDPDLVELAQEGYRKWDFDPSGERVLVGSTTQLTKRGFSQYLEKVHAFGAQLGVQFHPNPRERAA